MLTYISLSNHLRITCIMRIIQNLIMLIKNIRIYKQRIIRRNRCCKCITSGLIQCPISDDRVIFCSLCSICCCPVSSNVICIILTDRCLHKCFHQNIRIRSRPSRIFRKIQCTGINLISQTSLLFKRQILHFIIGFASCVIRYLTGYVIDKLKQKCLTIRSFERIRICTFRLKVCLIRLHILFSFLMQYKYAFQFIFT